MGRPRQCLILVYRSFILRFIKHYLEVYCELFCVDFDEEVVLSVVVIFCYAYSTLLKVTCTSVLRMLNFSKSLFILSIWLQAISCLFSDYTNDFNESGNYWEPLHYLLYEKGIQTHEWNNQFASQSPIYVIVFSIIGKIFQSFHLSRYLVFYFIRLSIGITAIYYLSNSVQRKFGNLVGTLCYLLCIFNGSVLFFLNRVNSDSLFSILNIFMFSLWLRNKEHIAIALGMFAVVASPSYAVVVIVMAGLMVWMEFNQQKTQKKKKEWTKILPVYIIAMFLLSLVFFFVIDSTWYKRPTIAFFNYFLNRNSTSLYKSFFYCVSSYNNLLLFLGTILGLALFSKARIYAFPYIAGALYHEISQQDESWLNFIFPILCFYCAIAIAWLLKFSSDKKTSSSSSSSSSSSNDMLPKITYLYTFIIVLYILSGLSTTFLRVYQYSTYHHFYRNELQQIVELDTKGNKINCLSAVPWSSWVLPLNCNVYTLQLFDEEFVGQYNSSFHRFESESEWALIPNKKQMDEYNIQFIIVQSSQPIPESPLDPPPRHKKQSLTSYLFERFLGNEYTLVAEAFPLGSVDTLSPWIRHLGFWLVAPGLTQQSDIRVASLVAYRKNKQVST